MRKYFALFLALVLCLGVSAAFADQTITVTGSGEALVPADTAVTLPLLFTTAIFRSLLRHFTFFSRAAAGLKVFTFS